MIFNKCLVIGEDCIIANFLIYFKNLVNFYTARKRLNFSVQLPKQINVLSRSARLIHATTGYRFHQNRDPGFPYIRFLCSPGLASSSTIDIIKENSKMSNEVVSNVGFKTGIDRSSYDLLQLLRHIVSFNLQLNENYLFCLALYNVEQRVTGKLLL